MGVNDITYAVRGCAFEVYNQLGPGLREVIYQRALVHQLRQKGLSCELEKEVDVMFGGQVITKQKLDLLVGGQVIIEIKAKENLLPLDEAQIITYLKVTGLRVRGMYSLYKKPINIPNPHIPTSSNPL